MSTPFGTSRRLWPKLRYRLSPGWRAVAAVVTAVAMVAVGGVVAGVVASEIFERFGLVAVLVVVPAVGVVTFALRAGPANAEPDDGWQIYVAKALLVGVTDVRPAVVRVATAVVLGVPLGWYAMGSSFLSFLRRF